MQKKIEKKSPASFSKALSIRYIILYLAPVRISLYPKALSIFGGSHFLSFLFLSLLSPSINSLKKWSSEVQRIWNQKEWGLTKRMMEYRRQEITWFSLTTLLAMASAMPLVLSRFKFSIQNSLINLAMDLLNRFCAWSHCFVFIIEMLRNFRIYMKNTLMKFWDSSEIWMGCDGDMCVGGSAADSGGAWCARGDRCSWFCFHLWDSVPSPLHSQGHLTTFCLFP